MLIITIILSKYITEMKSMMVMLEFEVVILYSYSTGLLIIINRGKIMHVFYTI